MIISISRQQTVEVTPRRLHKIPDRPVYAAETPDTALAEVTAHGGEGQFGIRFAFNPGADNTLDLADPGIAAAWDYQGGPITSATQMIGEKALEAGYNAIRFPSERGIGANWAILGGFGQILFPQMIAPVP